MTDQFVNANKMVPITPPPELIRKWNEEAANTPMADQRYIATQAARWGADQELDACCEWLKDTNWDELREAAYDLRADRRPQAPPETVEIDGHTYRLVK